MAVSKVDISLGFCAKDAVQSINEQLQTTRYFEGKDGIPSSTWRLSWERIFRPRPTDSGILQWGLNVDLKEFEAFKTLNVLATGKAHVQRDVQKELELDDDSRNYLVCFKSSFVGKQFDLPTTAVTNERVWSFKDIFKSEQVQDFRFKVDLNIVLICGKLSRPTVLQSHFADLFKSQLYSDLVLVADDKEFRVHKAILSTRSEVFQKMLEADMKERNDNRIVIEDVKCHVLEQILFFMYTGTLEKIAINEGPDFLVELFNVAEKYAIFDLKELAAQEMCTGITVQNVGKRFALACHFEAKDLRKKCLEFFRDNCTELSQVDELSLF